MHQDTLIYQADGLAMRGTLFLPPGQGRRAGVLVYPEVFGLGAHAIARAERLAEEGYVSLACDLHGQGQVYADLPTAMGLAGPLLAEPSRLRARAAAALAALCARPEVDAARIAAIGFCFGGSMALELARGGASLAAVVGFHCGLGSKSPVSDARSIRARVLMCIGADDPMVTPDQRSMFEHEMREGGVDWQLHLYGGVVHSFTNPAADAHNRPEALRYNAAADARSWSAMHALFKESLG